jgi:hypothetical protein
MHMAEGLALCFPIQLRPQRGREREKVDLHNIYGCLKCVFLYRQNQYCGSNLDPDSIRPVDPDLGGPTKIEKC